ncbi:ATP-dependent helicase [Virgibacillus salexigens]|uniref:DNA 3'-5' helicase n=1 Tax=Virgibacillus massiliensis TaxID=1462526 RepID=A0A024QJ02_9BACI|nr:UvrD-helicase domain-containing protein [Virgibacillus massiliensis]CDQ41926.1 ATP-dependent DNA helicase PcrA [Virgibacillus massiliensis]
MKAAAEGINIFQVAGMLAELNKEQREAATTINGRILVIAGAGSGKTKTLTTRIANMIANQVKPYNIFCATFTNKAAREMKERLSKIIGEDNTDKVWMGTFHSLCVRILRKHAHLLGYEQKENRCNFVIYDSYDVLKLIERIYKTMNIDGKYKPGLAMNYIDNAKNNLWTTEYCLYNNADSETQEAMARVYHRYQEIMKESNAMDFGDLIMNVVTILEEHPEAADYWQSKFHYVMSDEYQDTNPAQFALLCKLAEPHMNIFAVGDPDQSIYRFRGSDINIIMDFERHFSPCEIIKLEENYRSTNVVVQAGNSLISNNPAPYDKVLRSNKEEGDKIEIIELATEFTEAAYVASKIKHMVLAENYNWSDFAILYRAGFQSMPFEQLFVHNFIPFKVIGGTSFFEREEIKDASSYLRIIFNRRDDAAMLRVLNKPTRGIGKTSQDAVEDYANNHSISIYKALKSVDNIDSIKKSAAGKIKSFLSTLNHLEEKSQSNMGLSKYVRYVLEQTGIFIMYRKRAEKEKDGHERLENLEEFINLIDHYEKKNPNKPLDEFLQEMSLITDYQKDGEDTTNVVKMMTMHGSKGLEFPVVFNVGWNEKIFPSWRSSSEVELEEERRLAYVGITRAEEKLFISYSNQRSRPDGKGIQSYDASRFIDEISEDIRTKSEIL